MPRYKRFAPVSHDINGDAEVWEFTKLFGDRSYRTLVEVLIQIDKKENRWRLVGDWSGNLSRRVRQSSANVRRQVLHMVANGWLIVEETAADGSPLVLSAPNYREYHPIRKTKKEVTVSAIKNEKPVFSVPPSLSYPNLPYCSSKEEQGSARAETENGEEFLGLGERHPAKHVGWPLWSKLENFWRANGKRLGIVQLELYGAKLIEFKARGHDAAAIVETTLRQGWMDLYEPDKGPKGGNGAAEEKVFDFETLRKNAEERAKGARVQ